MFSKSFIAPIFLLALTSSVNAHAAIAPALGVEGTPTLNDVQKPSTSSPCGNINIADTLDTSTPVADSSDGEFVVTITNFDTDDGSRSVEAVKIDTSGKGDSFGATASVIGNGDAHPTNDASQQILAQLAASALCTGGTDGNRCLASFTTTDGFGNCVVIEQARGTASTTGQAQATATQSAGVGNTRKRSKVSRP